MSIFRSYFSKNNTLISNSSTNTGRNPVAELRFGTSGFITPDNEYTRFIFNLDLTNLISKIIDGDISTNCASSLTHYLHMTNSSSFEDYFNTKTSTGRRRATSFDLILFRIPLTNGATGDPQPFDEGVGYNDSAIVPANLEDLPITDLEDKSYSSRPSNWYKRMTLKNWSQEGIYSNTNQGTVNFSDLTIIDTQHFEFGNEDINFDMTDEINSIINGTLTNVAGWGIAYMPDVENITGLTETYTVGFFTRHTQTFYEPYLQTTFDDTVEDDRNSFVKNQTNKLYLYAYQNGDLVNLEGLPTVSISDRNDDIVYSNLPTCLKRKGIYEVTVPNGFSGYTTPCEFYDTWSNLQLNGEQLDNITNQFILKSSTARLSIGSTSRETEMFGFDFYGIKENEKILNTEIRKIGVIIKKAYTTQNLLSNIEAFYRIFVKEGTTEVQIQDWTKISRTPNEYFFMLDTTDKIPNQYYIDIKVNISGQKDIYKKELTFLIVNKK